MSTLTKKSVIFPAGSTRAIADGGNDIVANTIHDFANNVDFSLTYAVPVLLRTDDQVFMGKRATAATEGYELGIASGQLYLTLFDTGGGEMTVTAGAVGEYSTGGIYVAALWEGTAGNDVSNATIFVDGVSVALATVTNTLSATISNTGVFQLSGVSGANRNIVNGLLDWVCVYDALLLPATIAALYNGGDLANPLEVQTLNLLAFYPFEFDPFDKAFGGDRHLKNLIANGETTAATNVELVDFGPNRLLGAGANINAAECPTETPGGIGNRCLEASLAGGERWVMGDVLNKDAGDAFSVSLWAFRNGGAGASMTFVSKRDTAGDTTGWSSGMSTAGDFRFLIVDDPTNRLFLRTVATFKDSLWHHFFIATDGTETAAGTTIYVDAVVQSVTVTDDTFGTSFATTALLQISGLNGTNTNTMVDGARIAEVQLYDYALPATAGAGVPSVADIFNSGAPKYPTALFTALGPEAWWRPGEEFNHLDMVAMSDDDIVDVGFGDIGGGERLEYVMKGNDDGDGSQPSPFTWRVSGSPDFAAAQASPPFGGPTSDVVVLQTTQLRT